MVENKTYNSSLNATISNPLEYFKILVLQRVNDLTEAYETYYKNKHTGVETNLNVIHARTTSLYLCLYPYLRRKNEKFNHIIDYTLFEIEPNEKQLRDIFILINEQLDIDRLTRFDTKQTYDGTRAEIENEQFGL